MAEQKINHDKGIVTSLAIQALDKYLEKTNTKALIEAIKLEEPQLLPAIKTTVDNTALYFTENGVGPKTLSLIRDACFTCFLHGFLLYRESIKQWDTKKLNDMYNMDFDKWEDDLIDQYLASKKAKLLAIAPSGTIDERS